MKTTYFNLQNAMALAVSVILLQTLFFKFSAADVSVYIFTKLGVEPWGRIATGVMELIAAILVLIPAYRLYGAILTFGIISGALLSHIFVLGIEVQGDGGKVFALAAIIFVLVCIILYQKKTEFRKWTSFKK